MSSHRKKIVSVGFSYPDDNVEVIDFVTDRSILDADIIVFMPKLSPGYLISSEYYEGKRVLDDKSSFQVRDAAAHWRRELQTALLDRKTLVVFLAAPDHLQIDTGRREYSGTGRTRRTTRIVEPFTTYSALPIDMGDLVSRSGTEIRVPPDLGPLTKYWSEFGEVSPFQVYGDIPNLQFGLTTKTGNRVVGGVSKSATGRAVLVPPPIFDMDELYDETDEGDLVLTKKGKTIGKRLTDCLIEIDRELWLDDQRVSAPSWANDEGLKFPEEIRIETELRTIMEEIERRLSERSVLEARASQIGGLRALLYARGKELETAVLEGLRLLGFTAEPFHEGDSQFDAIFESDEGRFIGEVEGKASKPVNIAKLAQLERNLQEDYARESVKAYAKGVLFANVLCAVPPDSRGDYFTEKCISGALRSGIALVRTPDLFQAVLAAHTVADEGYKHACRAAIAAASGAIVVFPNWRSSS